MSSGVQKIPLPIDTILPELVAACRTHQNVILHAPPGAGKTTRVPLALLDLIPASGGRILMLEPRRIAAVSAARWMAACCGEEAGQTVGYTIRFESRLSPATRIEVVTEGVLTRRIQNDPLLEGVAMVIFDEFHERSINTDLGLALCRDVQRQVRPDLKLLAMSATLDTGPLSTLLGGAPVVSSPGRAWPVEDVWLDVRHGSLVDRMTAAVFRAVRERDGDILAFLPGAGEIRSCAGRLTEAGIASFGVAVCQLYGDLPFEEQQRAVRPGAGRKVVLATSIAETSLTIDGVRVVIDCGLSRRLRHDPASGMNRLVTVRASRASADQRRGRGGRQGPGTCYRLYGEHSCRAMTPFTPPEIMEADLAPLMLELAAWGSGVDGLEWLDPPPPASASVARQLLMQLGALDTGGVITPAGRRMARYPLHPRLAALLEAARRLGSPGLGCDLAALAAERDIVRGGANRTPTRCGGSDLEERLDALRAWRSGTAIPASVDRAALSAVDRVARQLMRLSGGQEAPLSVDEGTLIPRLMLAAYPDRIAQARRGGESRYLLSSGRGAQLSPRSSAHGAGLLIAMDVDAGGSVEGMIHRAVPIDGSVIRSERPDLVAVVSEVVWDEAEKRVKGFREERVGAVVLSSSVIRPDDGQALSVIRAAVSDSRLGLLDMNDAVRVLQNRVALLRSCMPQDGWPDISDNHLLETLDEWLTPGLSGIRTARDLAALDVAVRVRGILDYRRQRMLDELAPTHIDVPSGSRIRIEYGGEGEAVLAVKLQEMFGLAETPRIAAGRVPLLLHLLSPAGRPLQVTRDLKGFWDGAYHQVKKEMKGRYPRHPWPDDPWSAVPTRRAKQR